MIVHVQLVLSIVYVVSDRGVKNSIEVIANATNDTNMCLPCEEWNSSMIFLETKCHFKRAITV